MQKRKIIQKDGYFFIEEKTPVVRYQDEKGEKELYLPLFLQFVNELPNYFSNASFEIKTNWKQLYGDKPISSFKEITENVYKQALLYDFERLDLHILQVPLTAFRKDNISSFCDEIIKKGEKEALYQYYQLKNPIELSIFDFINLANSSNFDELRKNFWFICYFEEKQ